MLNWLKLKIEGLKSIRNRIIEYIKNICFALKIKIKFKFSSRFKLEIHQITLGNLHNLPKLNLPYKLYYNYT